MRPRRPAIPPRPARPPGLGRLIPPTWEELAARWRRQHPEDAHLTDTELEARFRQLQRGEP